jgi:hypothetical protein
MGVEKITTCACIAGLTACVFAGSASGISFSIDGLSPEFTVGVQGVAPAGLILPGDIFTPLAQLGPVVTPVAPPGLLQVSFPGEVNALSFGRSPLTFSTNTPAFFSLDRASAGVAGTASGNEFSFGAGVSEQSSDVFRSVFNNTNTIFADGDGVVQPGNPNPAAFPLGVSEFATFPFPPGPLPPVGGGDLDALDLRFDTTGSGSPTGRNFFSVDASTAAGMFVSTSDVLLDATGMSLVAPTVYAFDFQLGLTPGMNDIDALIVYDDGDNLYNPGNDIILFSLAPGSAQLGLTDPITGVQFSEGDILIDAAGAQSVLGTLGNSPAILHTAESLGLRTTRSGAFANDNLNALDVPEPASWLLLSLPAAAWLRRRSRC